jgi:integral membrane protein
VLKSPLALLRAVGTLEGASFLLLLFVAMPLKYLAGQPQMVRVVGAAHGFLFVAYLLVVMRAALELRWPLSRVAMAVAAAVLPFGPWVFDARLRREVAAGG